MLMEQTMRWFGSSDPVSLMDIRQAGATGVVSSLHDIPYGEVWSAEAVAHHRKLIHNAGLEWSVVESLPVHEEIKTRTGRFDEYIEKYKVSLRNLSRYGIHRIVYNFMPVLDWIRTDLWYRLPDGSHTIRFDAAQFAAFDLYILARPGAAEEYTPAQREQAERFYRGLDAKGRHEFEMTIVDNFPGCKKGETSVQDIREMLARYAGIDRTRLKEHLRLFLQEVLPVAEACGSVLMIHPDDPPFNVLGLPRIMSVPGDVEDLLAISASPANGICFCSGSFSGRPDNDLPAMLRSCAGRVHFAHLRSTQQEADGSFYEAGHLEGSVDMYALMLILVQEQFRRQQEGLPFPRIAIRPDHGFTMLDDILKRINPNPGYSCIGRLKGLAELRGLELGIVRGLAASGGLA